METIYRIIVYDEEELKTISERAVDALLKEYQPIDKIVSSGTFEDWIQQLEIERWALLNIGGFRQIYSNWLARKIVPELKYAFDAPMENLMDGRIVVKVDAYDVMKQSLETIRKYGWDYIKEKIFRGEKIGASKEVPSM